MPPGLSISLVIRSMARVLLAPLFICFVVPASSAEAQQPAPPTQDVSGRSAAQSSQRDSPEISSRDIPTRFKVRVNLVLVRVVVRDAIGKVVTGLKKEDFQLADNRKTQIISSFSVETPESHVPAVKAENVDAAEAPSAGTPVKAPELPQRFVALFFDDLHLSTQDALLSRQAAEKLFGVMQPGDRLAILTSSGEVGEEFTADREKLDNALQRIVPRPLMQNSSTDCPPMTYYEAYMIVEVNDPLALQVATQDAASCSGAGASSVARMAAQRELSLGEAQLQFTYQNLESLIRRMSTLPGQRVIVMMSPGFFVNPSMQESSEIVDRATKASVVINSIDARGLYVNSIYDESNPLPLSPIKVQFVTLEESAQADILAELADGTGGTFFHNHNDIDQGLLQAAAEPEVSYVLGFSPQNLKLDGKYHHLKVSLVNKQRWALQARHGYFAPHGEADPEATAKEEIQQAIFSQEEMHDVPLECQTQFFRTPDSVWLTVVTRVDTKGLRFRKDEDRNKDTLTISTVIFDENGNLLTGQQKILTLKLKDATLERVNKVGLSVKSSFDLQPGTFLVRIVVRDSEGAQMSATNRAVVIPH